MNNEIFFQLLKTNPFFISNFKEKVLNDFPKFKVASKAKESKKIFSLMWIYLNLSKFLYWITFKKVDLRFLARTTTSGYTIYLGTDWEVRNDFAKYRLIVHEMVHMIQWKKYWILYPITYVLVFPFLLSMRALWEGQAFYYEFDCYKDSQIEVSANHLEWMAIRYTDLLCDSSYLFAGTLLKPLIFSIFKKKSQEILNFRKNQ